MGIYPKPFTDVMHASVNELLRHVATVASYEPGPHARSATLRAGHARDRAAGAVACVRRCWSTLFLSRARAPHADLLARRRSRCAGSRCASVTRRSTAVECGTGATVVHVQRHVRRRLLIGHVLKLVSLRRGSRDAGLLARTTCSTRGLFRGEFFALLLFSLLGMMVMISANNFLTLYLGLELMSLSPVRDGGAAPRLGARHRSGDEVLRAGRAVLGPAAVRHVDDLRRHRLAGHPATSRKRDRLAAQSTASCWSSAWCSSWRASPSSSAWCRSTCGSRTSIRARRRR